VAAKEPPGPILFKLIPLGVAGLAVTGGLLWLVSYADLASWKVLAVVVLWGLLLLVHAAALIPPLREQFPEEPWGALQLRALDAALGKHEQVVLAVLGVFIMVVCILWMFTSNFVDSELPIIGKVELMENVVYDVLYATYLMAMIGGAFAAHHRRLLAMDVINRMVGSRARAWLRVTTTTFGAFITGLFFWYSLDLYTDVRSKPAPEHWMPADAGEGAMAIGAAFILVHLVVQIAIDLTYLTQGRTPPEPEMGAV
jgi:TRAP-type C4-dicarboxylate transport system permease small subunit